MRTGRSAFRSVLRAALPLALSAGLLAACSAGASGASPVAASAPSGQAASGQAASGQAGSAADQTASGPAGSAVATSAAAGCPGLPAASAGPPVGRAAGPASGRTRLPDLTLPCLSASGRELALRQLTGTPTVINLWASWCGPCRTELPVFERLHESAAGRIRVVGVDTEDSDAAGRSFVTDTGLRFPQLRDSDGKLGRQLGRSLLPTTVLVTADGRVAQVYTGQPLTDGTLRQLVSAQLGVALR